MHTHSTSHFMRGLAILAFLLTLGACSLDATETSSHDSHAAHDAHAAPTVDVTQSHDSEPPVPSEVTDARIDLERSDAPAQDPSGPGGVEGDGEHGNPDGHDGPKKQSGQEKRRRHVDRTEGAEPPKPAPEEEHVEHAESPKPAPHGSHHHGH
jgi:hypothetical protein